MMVNPFKSKKGVAIEMSIIFLLTVFFLCVIIVMLSLSISHQGTDFVKEQNAKFVLDEVGGLFLDCVQEGKDKAETEQAIAELLADKRVQKDFSFFVSVTGQDAHLSVSKLRVDDEQSDDSQATFLGTALEVTIDDGDVVRWAYN